MSPNVGNFVHDLVEMAKAMETLPQVQHELDHAKLDQHNLSVEIDRLKADLEQSRNYAASLEQKVKTTEAERDDAELRFLEVEDRLSSVVNSFRSMQATLGHAVDVLDPPKPQPEPEAQPQPPVSEAVHPIEPQPQGQGESPSSQTGSSQQEHGDGSSAPQPQASQGQGEVNPSGATSANTGVTQENAGQSPATTLDAGSSQAGHEGGGDKTGPYTSKRYYDAPAYISPQDWIAGGGTQEDYNWRPDYEKASF